MKYLCVLLIFVFSFSCKQKQAYPPLESRQVNEEINFKIEGIEPDNFEIVASGDTTYYLKQLLDDIDGKTIVFDTSKCVIELNEG